MGRQYYGISKSFNGDTYQVELHNSAVALDAYLTIKNPKIDWKTEGEYLYDCPILASEARVQFIMRDGNDHQNFQDMHLEAEEEWSMKILKNGSLHWVGRVVADQMRFPREAESTGYALIEVTAVDGLNYVEGFFMSAINFSIGDRQTVINTIAQIVKLNGLSAFWGGSDVYIQDGCQLSNAATGAGGPFDGSIRELAFIKNFDTFKDLTGVEWMDAKEGLSAIMTAFGCQILHSEGKYIIRQAPAHDDSDYPIINYDKDGGDLSTGTYTHRHLVQTTEFRPQFLSYPIKTYQKPVREVEVQFDRENGAFEYKTTSNTTVVSAVLEDAVATNNAGTVVAAIGKAFSVIFAYRIKYSISPSLRWNLRYRVWCEDPVTGDKYVLGNGAWLFAVGTVNYRQVRIPTPPLYRSISSYYEGRHEFDFPEPPVDASTINASFYIEQEKATIVKTGGTGGAKIIWTTPTATNHAFTGSVLIRQSYTDDEPITFSKRANYISDLDPPADTNSKRLVLKSEFYNGTIYDVGSYLAWSGTNYVTPGAWSGPWTALTGDLPELLANQWTGVYSEFRDQIDGTLYDSGDYEAGMTLFFDDIIWVFNGGTHNLYEDTWDGQWVGVNVVYTLVNDQGEGEYVLQEGDILIDRLGQMERELGRLREHTGNLGDQLIQDVVNDGDGAPTSDPGMDRTWSLNLLYDSTEPDFRYLLQETKEIIKSADESISSDSTLSEDSELKFYMEANSLYHVELYVSYTTTAVPQFKYALSGPNSPSAVAIRREHGAAIITDGFDTSYTASTAVTGTNSGFVLIRAIIQNGANAGFFAFQWAQNTSDGTTTKVLGGSKLKYTRQ